MNFDLQHATQLLTVAGSRAYGLASLSSDVDLKGVAIPPARYFLGFRHQFEQADQPSQMNVFTPLLSAEERSAATGSRLEGSVYGLRKFVRLAADCNPHMLDLLYCRDEEVRLCTDLGTALRDARNMFLSERARHSFGSYARSQLKRIQGHRKWLLAPPRSKPTRADFGLPEVSVLPRDQLVAAENAVRQRLDQWQLDLGDLSKAQAIAVRDRMAKVLAEQQVGSEDRFTAAARGVGLGESFIEVMKWERAYRNAMRGWKQYQNWKFNRNPARAALEAKYGYDTKHAAHLVRLLRMAVEILREGQVFVWRGQRDADELRAIRDGAWSYDQLIEFTDSAEAKLVELELAGRVAVPKAPDLEGIDDLVVRMVGAALDRHA